MKYLTILGLTLLTQSARADFGPLPRCAFLPDQRVFLRGDWTYADRDLFLGALRQSVVHRQMMFEPEREAHLIHEVAFEWADQFSKVDLSLVRPDYYASYKKVRLSLKRGANEAELVDFLSANLPARREPLSVAVPKRRFWAELARTCAEALKL